MIYVNGYWLKEDGGQRFHVVSYEIRVCPICGHVLLVIGTRKRGIINSEGEKQILIIRRMRCKDCRAIHHELPDIIIPYKRHCADSIEKIIAGDVEDVCCDDNMIRRIRAWWAACLLYFESVLASLREKYELVFSANSAPREIVRAVANAHLWLHTRSAFLSG